MICLSINRQLGCPGSCVLMSVQLGFAYYLPTGEIRWYYLPFSYANLASVQLVSSNRVSGPGSHELGAGATSTPVDGRTSLYGEPQEPEHGSGSYSGANIDGSEVLGDTI